MSLYEGNPAYYIHCTVEQVVLCDNILQVINTVKKPSSKNDEHLALNCLTGTLCEIISTTVILQPTYPCTFYSFPVGSDFLLHGFKQAWRSSVPGVHINMEGQHGEQDQKLMFCEVESDATQPSKGMAFLNSGAEVNIRLW